METRLKMGVHRVGRQGLWKEEPVSSSQSGWGASFPITLSLFLAHRGWGVGGRSLHCPEARKMADTLGVATGRALEDPWGSLGLEGKWAGSSLASA